MRLRLRELSDRAMGTLLEPGTDGTCGSGRMCLQRGSAEGRLQSGGRLSWGRNGFAVWALDKAYQHSRAKRSQVTSFRPSDNMVRW